MPDVSMLNYFNADYAPRLNDSYNIITRGYYLTQDEIGDKLADGDVDTYQAGAMVGFETSYGLMISVNYSTTGDNGIRIPFGDVIIVGQNPGGAGRADEDGYLVRLMYHFDHEGPFKGLWFYIDHAFYDTPESGKNATDDYHETDYNFFYDFSGPLEGLGLRFSYVDVNQNGKRGGWGGYSGDFEEFRYYMTYSFKFSGI